MISNNLQKMLLKTEACLKRNSPTILSGIAVVGVIATTVTAVKATPKAVELIKADSRHSHDGNPYSFTKFEAIKSCWKCYVPSVLIGLSTISCILGANTLSRKQQASLISAYGLLDESYKKYRKAARNIYGEDADSKIKAEAAKMQYVSADGYSIYSPDMDLENEKVLFYDSYSQRYFTATVPAVLNAQYHINRNLTLRGEVCINEFYEFIGIDKIKCGDDIGWSMDDLMEGGLMWLDFENMHTTLDDGLECCIISSWVEPSPLYYE